MNPFEVLEIPPDASAEDIKAAYHRLAKQWHPDRFTGKEKEAAEAKFRALAEAFSTLKDPVKRAAIQPAPPKPRTPTAAEPDVARERTPEDWAAMAREALSAGKLDQARALIHYAIRMDAGKAAYHALLASILEQDGGDLRQVVKALETAVRLDPKDVESHLKLANHFEQLGMGARSQRHLRAAMDLAPNHPKLRQYRTSAPQPRNPGSGKSQAAVPPQGLLNQLKDLWNRLNRRG
ncbi:MAG TPA: DnaJ domain-containing protein [Holophagaceae bacterium]